MSKRLLALVMVGLAAATAVHAQYGGGGMGGGMGGGRGGGHGGGHRGGKPTQPGGDAQPRIDRPSLTRETPLNKVEIVGVVRAIDRTAGRITIAYEDVDALNWPAGTMPFEVSKTALLDAATVGEKVRFKLESQQISDLAPYAPRRSDDRPGLPGSTPTR